MRLRALSMNEKIEKEDQSLVLIAQKILNIFYPLGYLDLEFSKKKQNGYLRSKKLQCYIAPGNNSLLVKKIMQRRPQWNIADTEGQMINLKWKFQFPIVQQYQDGFFQIQNHISNHQQLTEKANLINNLFQYCQNNKISIWDITPVSFVFDLRSPNEYMREMKDFQKFYSKYHPLRIDKQNNKKKGKLQLIKENKYVKRKMHSSMVSEDNNYLWIFKPTQFNRGRGIQLFQTLDELNIIIKQMEFGTTDYQFNNKHNTTIKSKQFIIQKYIQRPFLIDGRKFDIRTWVLITQDLDIYLFEQGYLRMASEQFTLNNLNTFIHLTNNAVQKYSQNYNQFEQGNQLSYQEFDHLTNDLFTIKVLPIIKQIIVLSMYSVKRKLIKQKYNFELLGYDFMIDENLKPWLIEINANPCLEESSQLLTNLLPKMLDDAFQLVIDIYSHKKPKQNNQWEHLIQL